LFDSVVRNAKIIKGLAVLSGTFLLFYFPLSNRSAIKPIVLQCWFLFYSRRIIMKLKTLFVIDSILAFAFGLGLILLPGLMISMYGMDDSASVVYLYSLLGAAFLGNGIFRWLVRDSSEEIIVKTLPLAIFMEFTIATLVALKGQLVGGINALGWLNVGLYVLLAIGYAYFRFVRKV
jgi:hypothetical protein